MNISPQDMKAHRAEIPVSELMPGMTVLKIGTNGKLRADVTLKHRFITSDRFPSQDMAFLTTGHQLVVWRNCGTVNVTW